MWRCYSLSTSPAAWAPAPEGSTKLDLAKAAAIAAADIMNPTDQVGILGFDATLGLGTAVSPGGQRRMDLRKAGHRCNPTAAPISTKRWSKPIAASLRSTASIKHVIVLSDGLTDKADFHVAGGKAWRGTALPCRRFQWATTPMFKLMAEIAKEGKGRGYVALDPQTIPQIFTTETLLISRDLLIEKLVTPSIVASVGPLKGIAQGNLPSLRGYVLTYPKPRAELLMKADNDPLLVSWRYGLGRVMAFTSDLSGRWGKEWVGWHGFPQWASQTGARYTPQAFRNKIRVGFPAGRRIRQGRSGFCLQGWQLSESPKAQGVTYGAESNHSGPSLSANRAGPLRRKVHSVTARHSFLTMYAEGQSGAKRRCRWRRFRTSRPIQRSTGN